MALVPYSETGEWALADSDQDVRGFAVVDASGATVGTVDQMLVDTEAGLVTVLVLADGTEVGAASVTIGETVVYLGQASFAPRPVPPEAPAGSPPEAPAAPV